MTKRKGCPSGHVVLSGQCFREKDKKKIVKKGFKYVSPVKSSPGSHWFKSPDDIKTIGSPIGNIKGKRVGWSFGKRWGDIPSRYVHGAPKIPKYKIVNGRVTYV